MPMQPLTAGLNTMSDPRVIEPVAQAKNAAKPVKLKGVALPNEHGAWGMLFEPLVAGLAVAFSLAGLWIALAVIAAFMMRQPLKVLLLSWRAGRKMPQTAAAGKFFLIYSAFFVAGCAGTLVTAPVSALLPMLIAAPLAAVPIYFDAIGKSRKLAPEIAGALAITGSAAVLSLAGGWTVAASLGLWTVLVCRWIPSILYVRDRLLREKGKPFSPTVPVLASLTAVMFTVVLGIYGVGPWLAVLMMALLSARAAYGLSRYAKHRKAMMIGVFEVIYGTVTVLAIVQGYRLGL